MKRSPILFIVLISIIFGSLLGVYFNYLDVQHVIKFEVTQDDYLYILEYRPVEQDMRLIRSDINGKLIYSVPLPSKEGVGEVAYTDMSVDNSGNVYLIAQYITRQAIGVDSYEDVIAQEKVLMYNKSGEYVSEVASVDFKNSKKPVGQPYFIDMYILGNRIYLLGLENNRYDVYYMDSNSVKMPQRELQFEIIPENKDIGARELVREIRVFEDMRVIYSTNNGGLFVRSAEGEVIEISSKLSGRLLASEFTVDEDNRLHFVDYITGVMYMVDLDTMVFERLFGINSVVNSARNIIFEDIEKVDYIGNGRYSAIYDNGDHPEFVVFGTDTGIISKISSEKTTLRFTLSVLFYTLIIAIILMIIYYIIVVFKNKTTIALKIFLCIFPIYILAMSCAGYVIVKFEITDFSKYIASQLKSGSSIVLRDINYKDFVNIDHVKGFMNPQYNKMKYIVKTGLEDINQIFETQSDYMSIYAIIDGKIYLSFTTMESSIGSKTTMLPIEMIMTSETTEKYYKLLVSSESMDYIINSNEQGNYIGRIDPIYDTDGGIVGIFENSINKVYYNNELSKSINFIVVSFVAITIIIFIALMLVLKAVLKPLKYFSASVNKISEGDWDAKVIVRTRDEIADIGDAFNIMIDRINHYISNLMVLNKSYMKFVPKELFNLLGKSQITDVRLYDSSSREMTLLFINFNAATDHVYGAMSGKEYFDMMNAEFNDIFEIIRRNKGIIERFDGSGMMALFPYSSEDAIVSSIQIRESFGTGDRDQNIRVIISTGETLIGVAGNDTRSTITTISDEVMQIYLLNNHIDKLGIKNIVTEPAVERIKKRFDYRFIGLHKHITNNHPVRIYELIDGLLIDEKRIKMSTKDSFECGVEHYINGRIDKARKCFVDVLRIDEHDAVCMYYMMICDKWGNDLKDFNGELI